MLCFAVYKVNISKISRSQYDRYEMDILVVIKQGTVFRVSLHQALSQ